MATDFTSYLGVKFKFDSAEARADIVKLLNDLDYFEKKLKGNFDTKAITDWNNKIDIAKQGLNEFGVQVDTVTQQSYQNFRAIGQMDRVTREFASGGLTSGLNGLTMFGNSLTRLAVQEGGFKNALSGLIGAFTGPAGIVLAISAAIGFFEEWQKTQKKAETATQKHAKEIEKEKQDIDQLYESTSKEATQVTSLVAILSNETETRNRKTKALEELKKINPEIFKGLTLEQGVVIGLNTAYEKYITNLSSIIALKIKQKEIEDVTEKILKAQGVTLTQEEKDYKTTGKALKDSLDLKKTDNQTRKESTDALIKENKENAILNSLLEQRKKLFDSIKELSPQVKISGEGNTSNEKLNETEKIIKKLNEESQSLNYQLSTGLIKELPLNGKDKESYFSLKIKAISDAIKQLSGLTSGEAKSALSGLEKQLKFTESLESMRIVDKGAAGKASALGEKQLDPVRTARELEMLDKEVSGQFEINSKKRSDATLKEISKQQQAFEKFGNTIANEVTGAIMGMWDAMQHGENAYKALSDMMSKIAEQLVATAIKAAILSAILASLPGADVAVASNGGTAATGFFDIFKSLLGIPTTKNAAGGITNGPSWGLIGEAGPEAIMPLSKLGSMMNSTFSAGAMSGSSSGNGGQFVLRGQDLLLAVNRTQKSSSLKGQSISLA